MADNDATETAAGVGTIGSNKVRSKNGVARVGLKTIDEQAKKIWNVARTSEVAEVQIARALAGKADAKASGGGWRARIAMLRLYGIVDKTREGFFKMTDLGIALANTGDEAGHQQALRTAVVRIPANSLILKRYDGGELPGLDTLATEFEFGYSLSNADAKSAAQVFLASGKYAGLVSDGGHVSLDGTPSDLRDELEEEQGEDEDLSDSGIDGDTDAEQETPPPADTRGPRRDNPPPPPPPALPALTTSPVSLSVKLDMSGWAVDDVLRVLGALGYESTERAGS
ncbi:hypothetical protein [Microbacterium terricola]|uniref:hypothetical protein n=1 Tax=Microbacterium terricola TaxID=344163 RepID=UPI0021E8FD1E|nr:hypothetical protein [Microbacterium terricola]UYK40060.1 hypothetical protein OAU46_15445 [Microbacterium terricola]